MESIAYLKSLQSLYESKQKDGTIINPTSFLRGFNSSLGIYFELAKLELKNKGQDAAPIRYDIFDKAFDHINSRRDCADFIIPGFIRILHEHRDTGHLSAECIKKMEASLVNFRYWLDEPGPTTGCYFTENHQILFHSAEYLVGQLFPDTIFPSNGETGAWHQARATVAIHRWLDWRTRFGFSEWLTQGYYMEDIMALIGLYFYAEEADIRVRSQLLIDMLLFDMAVNGFKGHLPTTHGRVYAPAIIDPDMEDNTPVMALMWDEGTITSELSNCGALMAAYDYQCPKAIVEVAHARPKEMINKERMSINVCDAMYYGIDPKDFDNIMFFWGMQTYSDRLCIDNSAKVFKTWNWMHNRVMAYKERYDLHDAADAPCVDAPDYTAMTQVDIYTRKTPDYILSCAQDFRRGRMGYQQHPWTASLGDKAVVFTTSPASNEYTFRPNLFAGNLCLPRAVAHQNVLLCIYRVMPDFVDYLCSHAYFPQHEFDEVVEKHGFVFGRKKDAYIAMRSLNHAYWKPADPLLFKTFYGDQWESGFKAAKPFDYVAQGHANVWAFEMGSKAENESFENFIASFKAAAITGDTHHCTYHSPALGKVAFGWNTDLAVNGETIEIHDYPRYDNPYCQAAFDTQVLDIHCAGHRTLLDHKNLKRIDA